MVDASGEREKARETEWKQWTLPQFAVPEIKKAAERLPQLVKIRTLTQKVDYQMKYGKSRNFWGVRLVSDLRVYQQFGKSFKQQSYGLQLPSPDEGCRLLRMTKENWWVAAKVFLGLPVLFYVLLSVLEPQREIWRKPTKKVLVVFIIAWSAVLCFIALVFAWNALW